MKEEGHLFLERPELIQRAYTMLNQDLPNQAVTETDIQRVLYRLVMQESIVVDGERVYVKKQYEEENQTASMIARCLLDQGEAYDIEKELAQAPDCPGDYPVRKAETGSAYGVPKPDQHYYRRAWNRKDHRVKGHPLYPCHCLPITGTAHGSYGACGTPDGGKHRA